MNIEIARPILLILIPLFIFGYIYSAKFLRIKNKGRKISYITLRIIVVTLLVLALSGVSIKWSSDKVTTIFLVDLSDSNVNNVESIEEYLRNVIKDVPDKNSVGIITFGADSTIEQFVTEKQIFDTVTTKPTSTATNIEQAINTGLTMYPDGVAKQMVLITDGAQNTGDVTSMASAIIAANVTFKTIKLEESFGNEVYVNDVTLPNNLHVGDSFSVTASIKSNVSTSAIVSLYSGRTLKDQKSVQIEVGDNKFVFNDIADENGIRSYRVVVEAVDDTIGVNNEYSAFTQIDTPVRVLVIEGQPDQGNEFASMLDALGMNYDKVTTSGVPNNMADLNEYDVVVTIDVYYSDLKKGFAKNLQSFVKDYAGGYICIGGENSYALGGYRDTELEEVLPVNMDLEGEKEIPKMAMVMVIDHSGSMTSPSSENSQVTGLDLAKQAAIAGVYNLRPTDECGVLAFDDGYTWTVPIKYADDIDGISESIATIGYGGGTSIYPAIEEAAEKLAESDAQIKHIILLTDGQDEYDNYDKVINYINYKGISLSSVAVGSDANTKLLEKLAEDCEGRYYFTDVNNSIPRIFAQEVFLSVKSYLINEDFTPIITNHSEIINEVLAEGYPMLRGYVSTTPKATATVILESHKGDPILTTWQYGIGKSMAWTSDGENKWSGQWAAWENYSAFWKNAIDYVTTDTSLGDDTLNIVNNGNSATITYGTNEYSTDTIIRGICTSENGEVTEITLDPIAPGKFQKNIALDDLGIYSISLVNSSGESVVKSINTATAMQYSPEYRFNPDNTLIDSFTKSVNGSIISMEDEIFGEKLENVKARMNLLYILILLALLLFMVDIVSRRFQLDYAKNISKHINKQVKEKAIKKEKNTNNKQIENIVDNTVLKQSDVVKEKQPQSVNVEQVNTVKEEKKKVKVKAEKPEKTKKQSKKKENVPQTIDTAALLKKKNDR